MLGGGFCLHNRLNFWVSSEMATFLIGGLTMRSGSVLVPEVVVTSQDERQSQVVARDISTPTSCYDDLTAEGKRVRVNSLSLGILVILQANPRA